MTQEELQELRDRILNPLNIILNTTEECITKEEAGRILEYVNTIEAEE